MKKPPDSFDDLESLGDSEKKWLRKLSQELQRGNLVLFAGAGLSFNARSKDGSGSRMPGWPSLAERLRADLAPDLRETKDVLKIADYYETKFGRPKLIQTVMDAIADDDHIPGRVHNKISELSFKEIITTNYDTLLERAFEEHHLAPQVVATGTDLVRRRQPPRIIKMNGCFKINPSRIVVTGDDFLSYSQTHPLVEIFVLKSFVESYVLFIGFGLDDPAFRAINERVVKILGNNCPLSYSLQFGASDEKKQHWRTRRVQIIDLLSGDVTDLKPEERLYRVLTALSKAQQEARRPSRAHELGGLVNILFRGSETKPPCNGTLRSLEDEVRSVLQRKPADEDRRRFLEQAHLIAQTLDLLLSRPISSELLPIDTEEDLSLDEAKKYARDPLVQLAWTFYNTSPLSRRMTARRQLLNRISEILKDLGRFGPDVETRHLLADYKVLGFFCYEILRAWRRVLRRNSQSREEILGTWPPELPTLVTLLLLKLFMLVARDEDFTESSTAAGTRKPPKRAFPMLIQAARWLRFHGLASQDLEVRAWYLVLLCLLGPVQILKQIVCVWVSPRREVDLLSDPDTLQGSPEATPMEYRLPLLGFCGHLAPLHYEKAADSLWSRQFSHESENGEADEEEDREYPHTLRATEIAHRFRYLAHRAGPEIQDWPSATFQLQRLEKVATQQFIEVEDPPGSVGALTRFRLLELLRELQRGWIFGSRPPKALDRAWEAARKEVASGGAASVPWEALLVLTLPVDVARPLQDRDELLRGAWERCGVDAAFLIQYVALRLERGGFRQVPGLYEVERSEDAPIGLYEVRLAELVLWLVERLDSEQESSSLRDIMTKRLASALVDWLEATTHPEVRSHLLDVVVRLRSWNPEAMRPLIQNFVQTEVEKTPYDALRLTELDPPSDDMLLEPEQLDLLLAQARRTEARGTGFRRDLAQWLIAWSKRGVLEKGTLETFADTLASWLREGKEGQHIDWVSLAGRVQSSAPLRFVVEERLECTVFSLVRDWLLDLKNKNQQQPSADQRIDRWDYSKDALLQELAAFASVVDGDLLRLIRDAIDADDLTVDGREGASQMLAELLAQAPENLRRRHMKGWIERLDRLIAQGATGRGLLGRWSAELSEATRQALQDNLIRELERTDTARPADECVEWIHKTVEASTRELPDLEEALIEAIAAPHPAKAEAALAAVLALLEDEAFLSRQRTRVRRVRLAIEARGGYRKTSRFAANIGRLPLADEPIEPGA